MNTQTLMLGDIDIRKYVSPLSPFGEKAIEKASAELDSYLASERYFIKKLETEKISIKYPPIDLSFLKIPSKVKIRRRYLPLPKFVPYRFYGSNKFTIRFGENVLGFELRLPEIIENNLMEVFKEFKPEYSERKKRWFVNKNKRKFWKYPAEMFSEFNGIIPNKIKEEVKESRKYFDNFNTYLIAETKPKQWNINKYVTKDPLVIGIDENQEAHLIAHFNTTPLEDLIKNNFLKSKLC